jgi:hypothetical protein
VFGEAALAISIPKTTEVVDVEEKAAEEPIKIEPIDLTPFELQPLDLGDNFDFGFGDINTDFGFGLGGDVSIGSGNQFTSVNSAGDDFMTRASRAYSGTYNDDNDFNEPDIFA